MKWQAGAVIGSYDWKRGWMEDETHPSISIVRSTHLDCTSRNARVTHTGTVSSPPGRTTIIRNYDYIQEYSLSSGGEGACHCGLVTSAM